MPAEHAPHPQPQRQPLPEEQVAGRRDRDAHGFWRLLPLLHQRGEYPREDENGGHQVRGFGRLREHTRDGFGSLSHWAA